MRKEETWILKIFFATENASILTPIYEKIQKCNIYYYPNNMHIRYIADMPS